eukprot:TRINITY_DN5374_c0_g2_i1.p1 TRINITY_DN5374_c0_g2~~TRINITY_DN5374_c0_g2_i1.p1  ORF type:complete len:167 (+),score=37.55 TRINITY_DN5374_c0_g2_i1:113-613(+)
MTDTSFSQSERLMINQLIMMKDYKKSNFSKIAAFQIICKINDRIPLIERDDSKRFLEIYRKQELRNTFTYLGSSAALLAAYQFLYGRKSRGGKLKKFGKLMIVGTLPAFALSGLLSTQINADLRNDMLGIANKYDFEHDELVYKLRNHRTAHPTPTLPTLAGLSSQ